jgi:phosphomannomutase
MLKLKLGWLCVSLNRYSENPSLGVKVTFTPMHGVGGKPVQRAFRVFNLPELIPVAEQMEPDPDFPTVVFPNPEEGKSALVRY